VNYKQADSRHETKVMEPICILLMHFPVFDILKQNKKPEQN